MTAHRHNKTMKMIPLRRRGWSVIRQSTGTDQGWVRVGKAFPNWDPPRPSATADVHPSDGGDFLRSHACQPPWPSSSFPRKRESSGRPTRQAQQDDENSGIPCSSHFDTSVRAVLCSRSC
jgi:hypothetical protein